MNRYSISALATAAGLTLLLVLTRTGEVVAIDDALTSRQIATAIAAPSAPPPGFCVDLLVALQGEDDGGAAAALSYRLCESPPDAGQDAGWISVVVPVACDDAGCPDATFVLVPPDTGYALVPEIVASDTEAKCRKSAKAICERDDDTRINGCVDLATAACLDTIPTLGYVAWHGPTYAWSGTYKSGLDRIPRKAVQGICGCAPTWDAGGQPCKEWVTSPGLDGGDWKKADPGRVLTVFKGNCVEADCVETGARSAPGSDVCRP